MLGTMIAQKASNNKLRLLLGDLQEELHLEKRSLHIIIHIK
jgi:hypothetical protein